MSKKFDFNSGLNDLENIVRTMEGGDLGLDEALKQFEIGIGLSRKCQTALNDAEQKITILTSTDDYQKPQV